MREQRKCAHADCEFAAGSICNRPGCPAADEAGPISSYVLSLQAERNKAESELSLSLAREQRLREIIAGYEREVIGWARKVGCVAGTPPRELVPETAQRMSDEIARLRSALSSVPDGERS